MFRRKLHGDHITQGQGLSEVSARLSRLTEWCPGQGSNLHAGITRRGILSPLCLPVSPPGQARAARLSQKGTEGGRGIEPLRTPPPFCIDVVYTITYSHCQYTERSHDHHHCNSR